MGTDTGLQQCGEDRVIVGNPLPRLIRLNMDDNCD